MDQYPYCDEWKASVDRNGEPWRAYCEARTLVCNYFRVQLRDGKDAAKRELDRWLNVLSGEIPPRGANGEENDGQSGRKGSKRSAKEIERLRESFLLIGQVEGKQIKEEIQARLDVAPA